MKKFVNTTKEKCDEAGGLYICARNPAGERACWCEIQRIVTGNFEPCLYSLIPGVETTEDLVATPAGFGAYQ